MSKKKKPTTKDKTQPYQNKEVKKRFISIFSDYGFKVTFGNPNMLRFLKKAIQALIGSEVLIKEIRFGNTEVNPATKDSRGGHLDVTCTDQNGNIYIIEMQILKPEHFMQRLKFYAFFKFNTIIQKGDFEFKNLPKIFAIVIFKDIAYHDLNEFHHICCIRNQHGDIIDDQITYIPIELGKFNKTEKEVKTDLDKLLYMMKFIDEAVITEEDKIFPDLPDFFKEGWIADVIKELNKRALTPEQRYHYEKRLAQEASLYYQVKSEIKEAVEAERELAEERLEQEKQAIIEAERKSAEQRLEQEKQAIIEAERKSAEQRLEQEKQAVIEAERKLAQQKIEQEKQAAIEAERKLAQQKIEQEKQAKLVQQKMELEKESAIVQLLALDILSDEQIAKIQNVPLEKVLKLKQRS